MGMGWLCLEDMTAIPSPVPIFGPSPSVRFSMSHWFHFASQLSPADKKEWTRIDTKKAPPARFLHSAVITPEGNMCVPRCLCILLNTLLYSYRYIFGGNGEKGPLNDVWVYSCGISSCFWYVKHTLIQYITHIGKKKWKQVVTSGRGPSGRYGHAGVLAPNGASMFILGGYNKATSFERDIYQFHFGTYQTASQYILLIYVFRAETRKWVKWEVMGSIPEGSFYQSALFVDDQTLLSFGGRDLQSLYYNKLTTSNVFREVSIHTLIIRFLWAVVLSAPAEASDILDWTYLVPDEVLLHLFSYVGDAVSLCNVSAVCRRFWRGGGKYVPEWHSYICSHIGGMRLGKNYYYGSPLPSVWTVKLGDGRTSTMFVNRK